MRKLKKQWFLATPLIFGAIAGIRASLLPILADEVEDPTTPIVEEQESESTALEGWNEDQSSYYINNEKATGFQTIDNAKYYFNDEGIKQVGQKKIDNDWYVFDKDTGSMKTGFVNLDSNYRASWDKDKVAYYNTQGQMQYGQKKINSSWYVFDVNSGAMKTGFVNLDSNYRSSWDKDKVAYYNNQGQMQYGQKKINSSWYVFDVNSGAMKTGFFTLNAPYRASWDKDKVAYYNNQGQMQYGQKKINSSWYVFDVNSGAMKTGFVKLDSKYRSSWDKDKVAYYNTQGQMQFGQKKVNSYWYVFDVNSGAMKTGFVKLDSKYRSSWDKDKVAYYNTKGQMQYGQKHIDTYWYVFDINSGAMKTGFVYLDSRYHSPSDKDKVAYYDSQGRMVHTNFKQRGKTYIVNRYSGAISNYSALDAKVFLEGIDISEHNGYIDLTPYKDGFVIIRTNWYTTADYMAIRNMELCEKLGIPYGVYCYSYALSNEEAAAEADKTLSMIAGRKISCGVWFDMEDADGYKAARNGLKSNLISQMCQTYCSKIEAAGYYAGIYASSSWFEKYIKNVDHYDKWVANWGTNDGSHQTDTSSIGSMQQYTSIPLDKNVMYVNPSTYLK